MNHKKGFTLIEMLVVATIIALLAAGGVVSYITFGRQARDAKRKGDVEQIRAALEMYRSTNNYYPNTTSLLTSPVVYLQTYPTDPKSGYAYVYTPRPAGCTGTSTCSDYYVEAYLETTGASTCTTTTTTCATGTECNYCMGPYGKLP